MSAWGSFTFHENPREESAGMWCDRCTSEPVVRNVHGSTLQELENDAKGHLRAAHADDPITAEYVGATPYRGDGTVWQYRGGDGNPTMRRLLDANGEELEPWQLPEERTAWLEGADGVVPWRSDVSYAGGGALVHTPTATFRTCSHEWTEHRTSPEGARQVPIRHRCAMSPTRQHDWHRCGCGGTTAAALTPGDPVAAALSLPRDTEPYQRPPMARCTVEPVPQEDLPTGPPRQGMDSLLRRFGHPPVDPYQRTADQS